MSALSRVAFFVALPAGPDAVRYLRRAADQPRRDSWLLRLVFCLLFRPVR